MNQYVSHQDIATAAGVSQSTVSRILSGKAGQRINPKTQSRVRATALQLGYQPTRNPLFSKIPTATPPIQPAVNHPPPGKRTGMIVAQDSLPATLTMVFVQEPVLAVAGFKTTLVVAPADPTLARVRVASLLAEGVSGILCCPTVYPVVSTMVAGICPVIVLWQGAGLALIKQLSPDSGKRDESVSGGPGATGNQQTPAFVPTPVATPPAEPKPISTPIPPVTIKPVVASIPAPKPVSTIPTPSPTAPTPPPVFVPPPVVVATPEAEATLAPALPPTEPDPAFEPVAMPTPVVEPEPTITPEEAVIEPTPAFESPPVVVATPEAEATPAPISSPPPMAAPPPAPEPVITPVIDVIEPEAVPEILAPTPVEVEPEPVEMPLTVASTRTRQRPSTHEQTEFYHLFAMEPGLQPA